LPESPHVVNALTVDVEEYYHGVEFTQALGVDGIRQLPSRVVAQTEHLLDLLDAHGARGTFFTLGVVAQRQPRLVRQIAERGHEVASHGWDHTPVRGLGPAEFRADLRRARHALENATGHPVLGYRAPNYSIGPDTPWAFAILAEEGHTYDSSVHPIVHDRYGTPDARRDRARGRDQPTAGRRLLPALSGRLAARRHRQREPPGGPGRRAVRAPLGVRS
jgi:polysaccharide deacetylase family protein (PEP-CTERM system associated)